MNYVAGEKYVGLLDCNNFFVSCEKIFRPDLEGTPVIVLSSNDGCVIARSKEVKDMGIPMGVPYFDVRKKLREVGTTVFSTNFTLYRDISKRIFDVLRERVDTFEQYSIDEAFFAFSGMTDPIKLRALKETIERSVGVPVSIGVGSTKTIAKYANAYAKKESGVQIITDDEWTGMGHTIPIGALWGVGRSTDNAMRAHGLRFVSDLRALPQAQVKMLFGVHGERLKAEIEGTTTPSLHATEEVPKSIMSSRSLKETVCALPVLEEALAYHVASVAETLRETNSVARKMSVYLYAREILIAGALAEPIKKVILATPTHDTRVLLKYATDALKTLFRARAGYKKVGVSVSDILPSNRVQGSLFDESESVSNSSELMHSIDTLNARFGGETVTIGRVKKRKEEWDSKKAYVSKKYTTSWEEIPTVKTDIHKRIGHSQRDN